MYFYRTRPLDIERISTITFQSANISMSSLRFGHFVFGPIQNEKVSCSVGADHFEANMPCMLDRFDDQHDK